MKTSKDTRVEDFVTKLEELDRSYRLLLARRDMLDQAIAEKEAEIQALLDKNAKGE